MPLTTADIECTVAELRQLLHKDQTGNRLRDALVGQRSDSVFFSQWERHKELLAELLDVIDEVYPEKEQT